MKPKHLPKHLPKLLLALAAAFIGCVTEGVTDPPPPAPTPGIMSLLLTPDTARVAIGGSAQLNVQPLGQGGTPLPVPQITWSVQDTSVATVSATGRVTGLRPGATAVRAIADGVTGRATVVVAGSPGLRIIAGAGAVDSVGARLPAPLVVEVADQHGVPIRGVPVVFSSSMHPQIPGMPWVYPIRVGGPITFSSTATDTTDVFGRAAVHLQFAQAAGNASVAVTIPDVGLTDTARYVLRPATTTRITLLPVDTTIHVGAAVAPRVVALDRWGNGTVVDTARLSVVGNAAAVDGRLIRSTRFGLAQVLAEHGGMTAVAHVSVMPEATIAFHAWSSSGNTAEALYTANLDGSAITLVRRNQTLARNAPMPVAWLSPSQLVFHDANALNRTELHVHDLATGATSRLLAPQDQLAVESYPVASVDREWVYFSGSGGPTDAVRLFRVRANGTGRQQLTTGAGPPHWSASPSPDGTQVVFVVGTPPGHGMLHVLHIATGVVRSLNVQGRSPRWSPDGSRIVFLRPVVDDVPIGTLHLINPDGSGLQSLGHFVEDVTWSPDGRYLLASGGSRLTVVDAATGEMGIVSLGQAGLSPRGAVWKP